MSKISFKLIANQINLNDKISLWIDNDMVTSTVINNKENWLNYTNSLSEGEHMIEIRTEKQNTVSVTVDQIFVDNDLCMPTQYDLDYKVWGHISSTKNLTTDPLVQFDNQNKIWWGELYDDDQVFDISHQPICLHQGINWRWFVMVKSNGTVWWSHDSQDYYLTCYQTDFDKTKMIDQLRETYEQIDADRVDEMLWLGYSKNHEWVFSYSSITESDLIGYDIKTGLWQSPGTYSQDFVFLSNNLDQDDIDKQQVILESFDDYINRLTNKWYYESYEFEPKYLTVKPN